MRRTLTLVVAMLACLLSLAGVAWSAPAAPTITPPSGPMPVGTFNVNISGPSGTTLYWSSSASTNSTLPPDPNSDLSNYGQLSTNPKTVSVSLAAGGIRKIKAVAKDNVTGEVSGVTAVTYTPETVLFEDDFNDSVIDTTKWHVRGVEVGDSACGSDGQAYSCARQSNVVEESGRLNLLLRKEGAGGIGPNAEPYSGAMVNTAKYGWGWPVPSIKASWDHTHSIRFRANFSNPPGGWAGFWEMNTGKGGCYASAPSPLAPGDANYELDIAEIRSSLPTSARFGDHRWEYSSSGCVDTYNASLAPTISDMRTYWHDWRLDVTDAGIKLWIDDVYIGQVNPTNYGAYTADPDWFLIISNWVGKPGTWGSGGGQPDASLPVGQIGRVKVDYVKVVDLP